MDNCQKQIPSMVSVAMVAEGPGQGHTQSMAEMTVLSYFLRSKLMAIKILFIQRNTSTNPLAFDQKKFNQRLYLRCGLESKLPKSL